jgi:hypothetical protein
MERMNSKILLLVVIAAVLPGCSLLRTPEKVVTAVIPGGRSGQPDPLELQMQVQRFTDDFTSRTTQALDEYTRRVGTDSAGVQALELKLEFVSAVISIASGSNPSDNLFDLVSVITLSRATIEDHWMKTPNGSAFQPWLESARLLETNVWDLAASVLKPAQVDELREAISQWYARNPDMRNEFFARPQQFASMVTTSREKRADMNSVFSLVGLDPTSGLDPAVREVTRTRLFAERAMFTLQRMPFLLRWQTELLAYRLADMTEARLALTNIARLSDSADRISRAAENVSQTAAGLPDRVSAERKEILSALEQQEGKLRDLAAEVNRSLVSGEKMSTSLNTTITTFDALMKRFGVGEPSTNPAPDTNSPPFNVLDYGKVANQVGDMAKDLNTLITSVNQSVPQITRLSKEASAKAEHAVDRAFRLGVVLVLIFLAGSVLAGLAYRALARKLTRELK